MSRSALFLLFQTKSHLTLFPGFFFTFLGILPMRNHFADVLYAGKLYHLRMIKNEKQFLFAHRLGINQQDLSLFENGKKHFSETIVREVRTRVIVHMEVDDTQDPFLWFDEEVFREIYSLKCLDLMFDLNSFILKRIALQTTLRKVGKLIEDCRP